MVNSYSPFKAQVKMPSLPESLPWALLWIFPAQPLGWANLDPAGWDICGQCCLPILTGALWGSVLGLSLCLMTHICIHRSAYSHHMGACVPTVCAWVPVPGPRMGSQGHLPPDSAVFMRPQSGWDTLARLGAYSSTNSQPGGTGVGAAGLRLHCAGPMP